MMIISGNLSEITNGLKDPKEMIGKPITLNGPDIDSIGSIIEIDEEKNIFFAKIESSLIGCILLGPYERSYSIIEK